MLSKNNLVLVIKTKSKIRQNLGILVLVLTTLALTTETIELVAKEPKRRVVCFVKCAPIPDVDI